MYTATTPECCPLCDAMLDVALMTRHLRALHEVVPDEATIADVPVSRHWLRMAVASLDRKERLVEAGAA